MLSYDNSSLKYGFLADLAKNGNLFPAGFCGLFGNLTTLLG